MGVLASVGWWEVWRPSPQGGSRSLQWSETGMEDPEEDPLAVYCFCVCSRSALLGDLGVSRSKERDLLSVLSIYPRFSSAYSLCIHCSGPPSPKWPIYCVDWDVKLYYTIPYLNVTTVQLRYNCETAPLRMQFDCAMTIRPKAYLCVGCCTTA